MMTARRTIFVAPALVALALALATTGCDDGLDVSSSRSNLDSADRPDGRSAPLVDQEDVAGLPVCSEIDLSGLGHLDVYVVADSGGLLALAASGLFLCVDDRDGLLEAGLTEAELPPENQVADGTPLPASDRSDGTPLPASGFVSDGTPLPATY